MITAAEQIETLTAWKRQLLPRKLPRIDGWEWATYCWANGWPGGDYLDVTPLNAEQWLVFLGDASGHGGAAAVLAAMVRMVLHSCPLTSKQERAPFCPVHGWAQTPPVIMSRLHPVLVDNSLSEQFMSAVLGHWKPGTARFDFVVAGAPLPRVWRQERQKVESIVDRAGLPLGISPPETYPVCHVTLDPGDAIVIFTDGLLEARNAEGSMFGAARVEAILEARAFQGAEAVKAELIAGLNEFLHGTAPQDDITLLVLKRWD
jgi:sigma-B regulation protein RsbU (phosphoserine phosphatase)